VPMLCFPVAFQKFIASLALREDRRAQGEFGRSRCFENLRCSYVLLMQLLWYAPSNVSVETGEVMMLQRTPTKVRATQTRIATTLIAIVLIAAWSGFVQPRLFAQTTTQTQNSVSDSSASPKPNAASTNKVDAQVLQELERMRARIEELETQLRQSGITATTSKAESNTQSGPSEGLTGASTATPLLESGAGQSAEAAPPTKPAKAEPFAFADWTWLNGNPRTKQPAFESKFFTPEIRADVDHVYDFNHPKDDTIGGSSEVFRSDEVHVTQLGVGGDFHYDNVRARLMTQFGLYSQTTPRNDASPARGQWNLDNAYRYLSEAYGGYHFNALHGINVDAGIFMSYIGLFSYYNFDNWAYQPSYVSSNTPWFFNGVRIQIFPTAKLKIEPWFINGWQSYGRFNNRPGLGGQILWRPTASISIISNNYGVGADALGNPNRTRLHTDDSIEVKYYEKPEQFLDRMAFSLTGDAGCETGGGVSCLGNHGADKKQSFLGYMFYNRFWFHNDRMA